MTDYNKDFNETMEMLDKVPGVKEHLNSFEVKMGGKILKKRVALKWTTDRLIKECRNQNVTITQLSLAKIECGVKEIRHELYEEVYCVLCSNNKSITDKEKNKKAFYDSAIRYMGEHYDVDKVFAEKLVNYYFDKIDTEDVITQQLGPDYFALEVLIAEGITLYKPM